MVISVLLYYLCMAKKKKKIIALQSFVQSLLQAKPEVRALYIASGVLLLSGILLIIWFATRSFSSPLFVDHVDDDDGVDVVEEEWCTHPRVLDGLCVDTEEERVVSVIAVMIENHTEARPQSGLARASVVYEAPVEGNYSRFLALFPIDLEIGKVGPVRSARPYFLTWAREYGTPMYMHVGGSPAALDMLRDTALYFDFNEFYRGQYFWRSTDRRAPHNTYTSSENWQAGWERYAKDSYTPTSTSWVYGEVEACTDACVSRVTVSFAPPMYQTVWTYSTSSERFIRAQAGRPHSDHDGVQIGADTLVVQYVTTRVLDGEGRLSMDTIGTGEAVVLTKGHVIEGVWKKESVGDKTRFFDMNDEEIVFTPGNIWIEVMNQVGFVEIE